MTEVICVLSFGDKKKAGINSLSKEEVTQKDGQSKELLPNTKGYKAYLTTGQIKH